MPKENIGIVMQDNCMNTTGGSITISIELANFLSNYYNVIALCHSVHTGRPFSLKKSIKFINLYYEYNTEYQLSLNSFLNKNKTSLLIFTFPELYADAKLEDKFDFIPRILTFHSRPDYYFSKTPDLLYNLEAIYKNTTTQILFPSFYNLLPKFVKKSDCVCIPNYSSKVIINFLEKKEAKRIVYLSRIDNKKGIDFLIKSFLYVVKRYPTWQLDIWGEATPEYYINELIALVRQLKLQKNINFKGVTKEPLSILQQYDFCVFPSLFEGFPVGLTEALSVGLPAIGLKCCSGVNELIQDGYNGFLCEYNESEFASKIIYLIENKDERVSLAQNAIKSVEKYDISIFEKKWKNLIENILLKNQVNELFDCKQSLYNLINVETLKKLDEKMYSFVYRHWYERIFSLINSQKHKIITILGIKIKFKRKNMSKLVIKKYM